MKRLFLLSVLLFCAITSFAQNRTTVAYVERDTCTLYMDIYSPATIEPSKPTVLFMFGGGFIDGDKRRGIEAWVKNLTDNGHPVVSIDYRLGLKGQKLSGLHFIKLLDEAIDMAVADLFSATSFLLEHGKEYGVDAHNLVISGSSAGAITALQAEYEICNGGELSHMLPSDFNYAGLMAFSGAIFDNHNPIRFAKKPCPMLLFHGTEDKIVPYKKIAAFNLCFAGTDEIVRILRKNGYTGYTMYRYEDRGHDVSIYMGFCLNQELDFMTNKVMKHSDITSDTLINDPASPSYPWGKANPKILYKD